VEEKRIYGKGLFKSSLGFSATAQVSKHVSYVWILDSGASKHMTGDKHLLSNIRHGDAVTVMLADGTQLDTSTVGSATIEVNGVGIELVTVYLVPGLQSNLLSVSLIGEKGYCIVLVSGKKMQNYSKGMFGCLFLNCMAFSRNRSKHLYVRFNMLI
jgi:hypothetical protein